MLLPLNAAHQLYCIPIFQLVPVHETTRLLVPIKIGACASQINRGACLLLYGVYCC